MFLIGDCKRIKFAIALCVCGLLFAANRRLNIYAVEFKGTLMKNDRLTIRREMVMLQAGEAIVLEAENAESIFFQGDGFARKSGAQGIDLQQINAFSKRV